MARDLRLSWGSWGLWSSKWTASCCNLRSMSGTTFFGNLMYCRFIQGQKKGMEPE